MLARLLFDSSGVYGARGLRATRHLYASLRWGDDLPRLAAYFNTDKWGSHRYAAHYQAHFAPLRRKTLRILEIGVGGYGDPRLGGESLRMWKAYFPKAQIYGLDLADKTLHDEPRIKTVRGSQDDEELLRQLSGSSGPFDIIIDDGSHMNAHVLRSFAVLFPLLAPDGMYAIEDTQTAYWRRFGGADAGDAAAPTSMNFLKGLIDGLNHREFLHPPPEPSYFQRHIIALHFYHNLVFVKKGINDEASNVPDHT